MSKSSERIRAGVAAIVTTAAVAALVVAPAGASKVVNVPTVLQISPYAYFGKVKASSSCAEARKVVLKQKGYGVLGRTTSNEKGKWEINPEDLKYKGPLPYKLYAEVKPRSQGAAGTNIKCLAATSKTIEIAGG
jgi:hypothetical protein